MPDQTTSKSFVRRVRVPAGFLVAAIYLWWSKPHVLTLLFSLLLVLPGLALRALAAGHVRKNEDLCRTGPYAYTRNPLYLGSLLLTLGFALAGGSWLLGLLLVATFLAIYLPTIVAEEDYLRARFPSFESYAAEVPRLLPRLTPATSGPAQPFSPARYRHHREYNAAMGAVAVYAVLAFKTWIAWHRHDAW